MRKTIEIDENFKPIHVLEDMRKGDELMIPYERKRMNAIKMAVARKNRDYRLMNRKSMIDIAYRVSKVANEGYITVKRMA